MADGGVRQAAHHGGAFQHPVAEPVRAHHVLAVLVQAVVRRVQALPEPGGNCFAGAAGVFAGGTERAGDRRRALFVVGEGVQQLLEAELVALGPGSHDSQEFPGNVVPLLRGQVVEALKVDIQDARGAVRALHIAADPK
ncbi:hypothetical protein D9M72_513450 [compost metagenome]